MHTFPNWKAEVGTPIFLYCLLAFYSLFDSLWKSETEMSRIRKQTSFQTAGFVLLTFQHHFVGVE